MTNIRYFLSTSKIGMKSRKQISSRFFHCNGRDCRLIICFDDFATAPFVRILMFYLLRIFSLQQKLICEYPIIIFLIVILVDSIILIHGITAVFISDDLQMCCINIIHTLCRFCNRDTFTIPNEERYFI